MSDADLLDEVLRLEHATVWLLGYVGARLADESRREQLRLVVDTHRVARDRLEDEVTTAGGTPTPTEAAYQPTARADLATAVRLQAAVVAAYDSLCATLASAPRRRLAADLLVMSAEQLAVLRFSVDHDLATATAAYPGR